jgi:cyclic beta-1,2-glucan glucanotransferase
MYRLIVESLLGLKLEVDKLRFAPDLPADWNTFKLHCRFREAVYHITVSQTRAGTGGMYVMLDGGEQPIKAIPLADDRQEHVVKVRTEAARSLQNND